MKLTIIKDNIVDNTIEIEDHMKEEAFAYFKNIGLLCLEGNLADKGDHYIDGTFTKFKPEDK